MKSALTVPHRRQSAKHSKKKSSEVSAEKPWEASRKEKVTQAKRLLQDANYPSNEVVRSVAGLLAKSWHKPENS
jgi:hypothetical protein